MEWRKGIWLAAWASFALFGQNGEELFRRHCDGCHGPAGTVRAPKIESLRGMSAAAVRTAMDSGSMREMSAALTPEQRATVANWLGAGAAQEAPGWKQSCAPGVEPHTDSSFWNGWGVDPENSRFQPAAMAGLSAADLPHLKLKWAFRFPGVNATVSQPALVGGRLYMGSADGTVYSLDAATGCVYWTFHADAMVRTAVTIGANRHAKYAVYFGDTKAQVYSLDAKTGTLGWKTKVDDHAGARITAAPALYGGRLYVPVSSFEEASAAKLSYPCCTFRGSVAAIDNESGKIDWKTYTIPQAPKPLGKNPGGTPSHGPSGAAVWSTPTLDLDKRLLYAATGNGYSGPAASTTDAVLALEMDTGRLVWSQQLLADDGWNFSCVMGGGQNCPKKAGPDFDIGASPILRKLPGGKRVLLIGQKSGIVHALDPDARGAVLWRTRVGEGSALGGIEWGMGADAEAVYVPVSDQLTKRPGGLAALRLTDGSKLWRIDGATPECGGRRPCNAAQQAAPTLLPGVVLSGSMDGKLRAHSTRDGALLWSFDTLTQPGGGAINVYSAIAAQGMLIVPSGYGLLGGLPGNVVLTFTVDGR